MKQMKEVLAVCLVLMAFAIPVSASNVVSIGDHVINAGQTIRVPIWLTDSTNIWSVDINLSYDSSVVQATTDMGSDKGDFNFIYTANNPNPNTLHILTANGFDAASMPIGSSGNLIIGYVKLKAVGDECDTSILDLRLNALTKADGIVINDATINDGSFTISGSCIPPPVPEVTPIILVSAGLIGLVVLRRIKRN